MLLKDKIVLITGGARGIGYECAKAYVKEGAKVVVADIDKESVEKVNDQLGDEHLAIECDVTKEKDVIYVLQHTLSKYERLDSIHNNAGIAYPSKTLHETSEEEWDRLMNVNLKSIFLTTKFGLEPLRQSRGSILNTSSLVGEIGQESHAAYTATKGGVNALTKSMALDYAGLGIRVNAVAPAGVWTPMLQQWSREQEDPHQMKNYLEYIHPLGYCPEGTVVAEVCVFLLSDMARFITGCILPVSGGAELGYRRLLNHDFSRDSSLVAHLYDERDDAGKQMIAKLIEAAKETK
jgi:meso-butanediol dehydrogenase/(S,S)-butanediol dehydrogenase/diacetyl reductase